MVKNANATLTRKCCCSSPSWRVVDVTWNVQGIATVRIRCNSCDAEWATKSRKDLSDLMDKSISPSSGNRTLRDALHKADEVRVEWLKGAIKNQEDIVAREVKKLEKYKKELDSLSTEED